MTPSIEQLVRGAIERFRGRQYREAEAACREILRRDSNQPDALHVLGLLAGMAGQADDAIRLIGQAVALQPGNVQFLNNLGNAFCRVNRWEEGIVAYRRALALRADQPDAQSNLALALSQTGRPDEAIAAARTAIAMRPREARAYYALADAMRLKGDIQGAIDAYRQAAAANPGLAEVWNNLGVALKEAGQIEQAVEACRKAVAIQPDFGEALSNLSNVLLEIGQTDQAIAAARQAMRLRPDLPQAYTNLANALIEKGNVDEGIELCRRALQIRPDFVEGYVDLGNALQKKAQNEEAVAAYEKAIALQPESAEPYSNLAVALVAMDRLDEAAAACERALAIRQNFTAAKCNLGIVRQSQGRLNEAIDTYRAALRDDDKSAVAHMNLGMALLQRGEFADAWREYEWRWHAKGAHEPPRKFDAPQWDGRDLNGQRLLIYAEQGFGDAIQFARFLPMAAERGGKIILECQKELTGLFGAIPGVEQIVVRGEKLPAFDVHCALMGLPFVFGTTLETIPARVPYLRADPAIAERWRARLPANVDGRRRRIGIAWSGSPTNPVNRARAVPLAAFAPIIGVAETWFCGLQKGPAAAQAKSADVRIENFGEELASFSETAGLIANLDLVITTDTSVPHLAAAMGKPVWLLVTFASEWRWLGGREDSPWYPTMRLFRQPRPGDWSEPIARIVEELGRFRSQ